MVYLWCIEENLDDVNRILASSLKEFLRQFCPKHTITKLFSKHTSANLYYNKKRSNHPSLLPIPFTKSPGIRCERLPAFKSLWINQEAVFFVVSWHHMHSKYLNSKSQLKWTRSEPLPTGAMTPEANQRSLLHVSISQTQPHVVYVFQVSYLRLQNERRSFKVIRRRLPS